MSVIASLGTASPRHKHQQSDILAFMLKLHNGDAPTSTKLKAIYRNCDIESRYSVLSDYSSEHNTFFPERGSIEPFPGVDQRMRAFHTHAVELSAEAIEQCMTASRYLLKDITHLITVSCTGLSAPGLDIELMKKLGLMKNIHRSSVNFMGCYAAIHALKQADSICMSNPDAVVLVVCTELCTLHFQKFKEDDHLLANSLFADGAAAALVVPNARKGIKMEGFYSEVELSGAEDMAWSVSETGFLMRLSSYIPKIIKANIDGYFHRAISHFKVHKDDVRYWALHPGGKRILEVVAEQLSLEDHQSKPAANVLRDYGNMSSASILFVLKELVQHHYKKETPGKIFGLAFGPGLTMESMILSVKD